VNINAEYELEEKLVLMVWSHLYEESKNLNTVGTQYLPLLASLKVWLIRKLVMEQCTHMLVILSMEVKKLEQ
jgi:hypothetical protein